MEVQGPRSVRQNWLLVEIDVAGRLQSIDGTINREGYHTLCYQNAGTCFKGWENGDQKDTLGVKRHWPYLVLREEAPKYLV